MRPCRGLLPSWACRQRHWVCDRAVGERCTTESIASIHKLHHWCRDVHTVHKFVEMQSTELRIQFCFSSPFLKYSLVLSPRCKVQIQAVMLNQHAQNSATYHTHVCTSVCTHQHKHRLTLKHCHSYRSIQYQHTVTTSAFHVPFKITRSSASLLIEEEWLFLPLKRHVGLSGDEWRKGRKDLR